MRLINFKTPSTERNIQDVFILMQSQYGLWINQNNKNNLNVYIVIINELKYVISWKPWLWK